MIKRILSILAVVATLWSLAVTPAWADPDASALSTTPLSAVTTGGGGWCDMFPDSPMCNGFSGNRRRGGGQWSWCDRHPDAPSCRDDRGVDCDRFPNARECRDDRGVDCDRFPNARECRDGRGVDCDRDPDARECRDRGRGGRDCGSGNLDVNITNNATSNNQFYTLTVTVENISDSTVRGWEVSFDLPDGHDYFRQSDAVVTVNGERITARNTNFNGRLIPGNRATFTIDVGRRFGDNDPIRIGNRRACVMG